MCFSSVPEIVGVYRVIRPLDALARVLLAERISDFEQRVVIKFSSGAEGVALAKLKHEGIVQLLGTGRSDRSDYLVLEYVDGLPMDEFCRLENLPQGERLRLLDQVMAAVVYAHRRLIIHADIKPSNVLVTRDENGRARAKVLDFGIAQQVEEGVPEQPVYTPLYASPEQREGKAVTVSTDVYLLGLLCSSILPKQVGGDLSAIIDKALRSSPEERYGSVEAMRDDLSRFAAGLPTSVRRLRTPELVWRWSRRRPLLAVAVAVFACVVSVSAVSVVIRHERVLKQRRLADQQLREAIQLTGLLQGELYNATSSLSGSEPARRQLRETARRTLDSLAPVAINEPLRIELARQFGKLAQLELADGGNAQARQHANREIQRGLAILGDSASPEFAETRRELARIQSAVR